MKQIAILLIRFYQLCLSPFLGNCCRFHPSCSEYSRLAFVKYGFFKGVLLTLKRLVRCGPWSVGGNDPLI